MTTLPTKDAIGAIGQTYGQVRTALRDTIDYLTEALGTSGTTPQINNPIIRNSTSANFGISPYVPGTTVQVAGSFGVTANPVASPNFGVGSIYLDNTLFFGTSTRNKLALFGTTYAIGVQPNTLYNRTASGFSWFLNGTHSDAANDPGAGGIRLMTLNNTAFTYKDSPIYTVATHGKLATTAVNSVFTSAQSFNAGLDVSNNWLVIRGDQRLAFEKGTDGVNLNLITSFPTSSIGTQSGGNPYIRSPFGFIVYQNGAHSNGYNDAGAGGQQLFLVDTNSLLYKNQAIYHAGVSGHGKGINADMVDGIHADRFVQRVGTNRASTTFISRNDADVDHRMYFDWNGSRMQLRSRSGDNTVGWEVQSDFASNANYANTAGTASGAANKVNPGNLAVAAFGDPNRQNTVEFLATTNEGNSGRALGVHYNSTSNLLQLVGNHGHQVKAHQAAVADQAVALIGGLGVSKIDKAYASARLGVSTHTANRSQADIHQFAFGSPVLYDNTSGRLLLLTPSSNNEGTNVRRAWSVTSPNGDNIGTTAGLSFGWDYLTNSGDPQLWVTVDDVGNILTVWDAEDPIDDDLPDMPPITGGIKVKFPTVSYLLPLLEKVLDDSNLPEWLPYAKFDAQNPDELFHILLEKKIVDRELFSGMAYEPNLKDFVLGQTEDSVKRDWRVQQILRTISQVRYGYTPKIQSSIKLIQECFKFNPKTRLLDLK